jgi:hypothetical protein
VSSPPRRPSAQTLASPGEAIAGVAGLVFGLSAFMSWYSFPTPFLTASITGWNTGTIGKLVFFVGLVVVALVFLHATGVEVPPGLRLGVLIAGLGAAGAILVLIRVIDVPDRFGGSGRSVGIWISLAAALAVVVGGLVRAGEELEAGPRGG